MTMRSGIYNWLTCNGRVDNLIQPQCPAVSPGGFDNPDLVVKTALTLGWTESGGKHYCPAHSSGTVLPLEPRAPRKSRTKSAPPAPETREFHEGEHQ